MSVAATEDLHKFEVDGLIPIVVDGEVVPRFQNREAARRMRRKKARQRAFLEEQIERVTAQIMKHHDEDQPHELQETLQFLFQLKI